MKRKMVGKLFTAAMLVSGCLGIAACGSTNDGAAQTEVELEAEETDEAAAEDAEAAEETDEAEDAGDAAAAVHVVTYYDSDGTTVLNTAEVEDGQTAEELTPEKEGFTFAGWYATPQMSRLYDFSEPVTKDTDIFAGFVSYVEDTRTFAIVGSGASEVLAESNWGAVIGDAQTMTKEDNAEANVYTITIDLEKGDQFQFAINGSWEDQRGYGYMDTIEKDGTNYFKNAGGLGDAGVKKANIEVAVAGSYTFYLTTYPGEDYYDTEDAYYKESSKENFNMNPYDTISWTYNGESGSPDAADGEAEAEAE